MIDIHIHTKHSPDGKNTLEEYVQKAIEMNIKKMGFSEHIDFDYAVRKLPMVVTNAEEYYADYLRVKEKYAGKIELLFGAEFGYDELAEKEYIAFAQKYPFDYVINSVHLVGGEDLWFQEFYQGKSKEEAYLLYLKKVLQSLDATYPFHVVGHLGYIMRKAPYENIKLTVEEFGNEIDDIFKRIIEKGLCLEINTNTRGVAEILPERELLERYVSLGGRKFTFGSDAHTLDRLCEGMKEVKALLKSFGIMETYHFEGGKERATIL